MTSRTTADANREAVERIQRSEPRLVDIDHASAVVPGMDDATLLHGGPPIAFEEMIDPVKGAALGAIQYEGWADSDEEAAALIASGEITLSPTAEHQAAAPMAGIVSPSMPVYVVENEAFGNRTYTNVNEGFGRTLRFGAYDAEVDERLQWIEDGYRPAIEAVLTECDPIDLKELIVKAIHRGDECHNRNKTASNLFLAEIAPALLRSEFDRADGADVLEFVRGNVHTFLNLSIAASVASLNAAAGIDDSTVVTRMCPNGTRFGLQISGLADRWFTEPSKPAEGRYFEGFDADDAAPVFGDSYNSEAAGLGGFAMAAAPAIGSFIGLSPAECIEYTEQMYEITVTEHDDFEIPHMGYRGTPLGIDVRRVVETGRLPIINTGIAHRKRGEGQVGAGIVKPPMALFETAQAALVDAD